MSSLRKLTKQESAAYAAYRAASADLIAARAAGDSDDAVAPLARRANARRIVWESASRRVEALTERAYA